MKEIASREKDEYYMKRALSLAVLGQGETSPNPMVGCVLVKEGRVIGEGYHHRCGGDHAEVEALKDAATRGEDVRGATAYVTLEPCCHFGRTPPCAQRLVSEKIARVVAAASDPNPKVKGGGLAVLREAGIEVSCPCLEAEARWLNRGFIRVQTLGRPWVTLKAAASLDGRMALSNGESQWITGLEARTEAHRIRASHDAVLVGVGTVLKDDPELTVRHVEGRNPRRVVMDSQLQTPTDAKAVTGDGGCLILTASKDAARKKRLEDAGARVIALPEKDGHVDLNAALSCLAQEGILTLMVEGGPRLLTAFMEKELGDWISIFIAPKIMGDGPGLGTGLSFASVAETLKLKGLQARRVGEDLLIEGRFTCSPDL
ncbi:MAG: bifunctional diaminohydroxyphosphoribosylaminopyrimidine deaminase/5-amino-6-(5-phosphoribosylamino)uracil reductase RibD [Fretibacterium sp.]|nr:bifunctional diaminohydroxyphosphoribosylaminopyrimidine deaminase/5-amino-6-(5-phosphoribosylamino)uracil reductase RibD [Fretibacterium sp.]